MMTKHGACLNTQILGKALSLAYPMMVFVTALRPRGSTLYLLPRCYISC